MNKIFWWWMKWAVAFNISILSAAIGLSNVMQGDDPVIGTVVGILSASIAIALAAVAIAKMRSSR